MVTSPASSAAHPARVLRAAAATLLIALLAPLLAACATPAPVARQPLPPPPTRTSTPPLETAAPPIPIPAPRSLPAQATLDAPAAALTADPVSARESRVSVARFHTASYGPSPRRGPLPDLPLAQSTGPCDLQTGRCLFPIAASANDAGVLAQHCTYATNHNEIYFGQCDNGTTIVSGLRFPTSDLSSATRITDAYIEFTIDGPHSPAMTLEIAGSLPDAGPFSGSVRPENLPLLDRKITWTIPTSDPWYVDNTRRSPDLTPLVRDMLTAPNWTTGKPLTFVIRPVGPVTPNPSFPLVRHRRVFGFERPGTQGTLAPRLIIQRAAVELPPDQQVANEDCNCHTVTPSPSTDQPVNLRTGNFWTQALDLAVMTPGPALRWTRTYASQTTGAAERPIGVGWQHPYALRLITPTMPDGEPDTLIVVSGVGNRLRFTGSGDGRYQPLPGIYSTLVRAGSVVTQTLRDQTRYTFDAISGQLTGITDPQGQALALTWEGSPARLTRIADAGDPTRFLALTSTPAGQIETVSDGARTVTYAYDASGDLTAVTDVMGRTTTYTYANHLMTAITDPAGRVVEQMVYDAATPAAKVTRQTLAGGRRLDFTYGPAYTELTTTGLDGVSSVERFTYDSRDVLTGQQINGQSVLATTFDDSFSPGVVRDGNGNATATAYTATGLPLQQTDALGHTTRVVYDAQNRPLVITDTLGLATAYQYDARGNVLRVMTGIGAQGIAPQTTISTYAYDVRAPGDSQLVSQQGPDGLVTSYTYTSQGQVETVTTAAGTDAEQTTRYAYDALGRVTAVTTADGTTLARTDRTIYHADNTIAQAIQSYVDGVYDPARPDEDLTTTYGYDGLGRTIAITDTLGHVAVTRYNDQGQVAATARNVVPFQLDADGRPIIPPFDPAHPDQNIATFTAYDGIGRTVLVTETGILTGTFDLPTRTFSDATTRVTRTEYDDLSRPVTVTLTYRPDLPVGVLPDVNVQTLMRYDGAGNLIWQRDTAGRWTKTAYDALNRPIKTIANYENGDPLTIDPANQGSTNGADTDLVSVTVYDAAGRVARQITNYVDGVFTATEPITDRITLFEYDALGRVTRTTQAYDPATLTSRTDTNRVNATAYDPTTGRVLGQQDALGQWTSQQYDTAGRPTTTVQNCRTAAGLPSATACAPFTPNVPDRNVPTIVGYDVLGRTVTTTDALGHVTRTWYDALGRTVAMARNAVDGAPATSDQNVTTWTSYNGFGQTTDVTDAAGATTTFTLDGLGRTVATTDAGSRVTRTGYDGTGAVRWTATPDERVTVTQLDGLGRPVATIQHYQDGVVAADEPADQDLTTRTVYDAAGRQVQTIDPAGRVTQFAYDHADRLIGVTENLRSDCTDPNLPPEVLPCNVVTFYAYDRAGNRTAITDANGHTRTFAYDAADRQVEARDALGVVTTTAYDRAGRITVERDPRGAADDRYYTYDELDRPTEVHADQLAAPITTTYDALGQRRTLQDATGTTTFTPDALGRITAVQAPHTGTVGYVYDARGLRTGLIYPDATALQYVYAPDGRLEAVLQNGAPLASYGYDPAGRLQTVSRANGAVTAYGYDGAGRLTSLATATDGATISSFAYELDRLGLRTQVTERLPFSFPVAPLPTPTPEPSATPTPEPTQGLRANYYTGTDFGELALNRVDGTVDFEWGMDAPDPSLPENFYSVRWSGLVTAPVSGEYTFVVSSDDGVRLWVDGELLIDQWVIRGTTWDEARITLSAGESYELVLEYFEASGEATARLEWEVPGETRTIIPSDALTPVSMTHPPIPTPTPTPTPSQGLRADYYTGADFDTLAFTRIDPTVDFAWELDSPDPRLPVDGYSVRWSGAVEAPVSGEYSFAVTSDDGVRLWIDGDLLIDTWATHDDTGGEAAITLTAGESYELVLEYFEAEGDAHVWMEWMVPGEGYTQIPPDVLTPASPPTPEPATNGLRATYYDGRDRTNAVLTRTDATVDFAWDMGSPDPAMPADEWSARWTGQVMAPASGDYTFVVSSDDGARLWVDGQLLIDAWYDQGAAARRGSITLDAGQSYDLVLEYYEAGGASEVHLAWETPGEGRVIIPAAALTPRDLPAPDAPAMGSGSGLWVTYYTDTTLDAPVRSWSAPQVNVEWGYGAPIGELPSDGFSARWRGQLEAPTTDTYTIAVNTTDSARLWVGGQLVVDTWDTPGEAPQPVPLALTAGSRYDVVLEYRETDDTAAIQLLWATSAQPPIAIPSDRLYLPAFPEAQIGDGAGLTGVYYTDATFTTPVLTRTDDLIAMNWGPDAPDPALPADGFAVRWTGQIQAWRTDRYRLWTTAGGGTRLWIDGQLVADAWTPEQWANGWVALDMEAGATYDVVLEYVNRAGHAWVNLNWVGEEFGDWYIPTSQLYPGGVRGALTWDDAAGNGDGVIDPGEPLDMQVALTSVPPLAAATVAGTLASSSPSLTLGTTTATYPALASGATVAQDAPYTLTVDPNTVCGTTLPLTLTVAADQATHDLAFTLPIGQTILGDTTTVTATDTPLAIPDADAAGIAAAQTIAAAGAVAQVTVQVSMTHTTMSDLVLTLVAPTGEAVVLSDHSAYGSAMQGTIFSDDAATVIWEGDPPYAGTFRPEQPLRALTGVPAAGAWTLRVVDEWSWDTGTLDAWALTITTQETVCTGGSATAPDATTAVVQVESASQWQRPPAQTRSVRPDDVSSGTAAPPVRYPAASTALYTIRRDTPARAAVVPPAPVVRQSPPPVLHTRTITYSYDGLLRLTGAVETPGPAYTYAYDLAGNRTGVWVDGVIEQAPTYNAANQVVGWQYDAAGNLLNDGTTTYTYDALGRTLTQGGTNYTYNGDGVLVAQDADGVLTRYTQDLVAPLTQVLSDGTYTYLYGQERLASATSGTLTWYAADALGSVRLTLDDAGLPLQATSYDPWGTPEQDMIAPLGFTGEMQDATTGIMHLRTRWYNPMNGVFGTRDSFMGWDNQPSSLHQYQYAWNSPNNLTDPSGLSPAKCEIWPVDLVNLCLRASRDLSSATSSDAQDTLNAREQIDYIIANGAYARGVLLSHGYVWAGLFLEHFLDGTGNALAFQIDWRDQAFINDSGIARATRGQRDALYDDPDLEPQQVFPLLHDFLVNYVQPAVSKGEQHVVSRLIEGDDGRHYSSSRPLPHDRGYQAAVGHVGIDGKFEASISVCNTEGYVVRYKANYIIRDEYTWHPPDVTEIDIPGTGQQIFVPHEWHKSLISAHRAKEFEFSISWSEEDRILVTPDFARYRKLQWWE